MNASPLSTRKASVPCPLPSPYLQGLSLAPCGINPNFMIWHSRPAVTRTWGIVEVVPWLHSVTSTGHSRVSSQTPQAAAALDCWVFRDTPMGSSHILFMLSRHPGMLVPQFMEILLPTLSSKGSAQKTHSPDGSCPPHSVNLESITSFSQLPQHPPVISATALVSQLLRGVSS